MLRQCTKISGLQLVVKVSEVASVKKEYEKMRRIAASLDLTSYGWSRQYQHASSAGIFGW